MYGDEVVEAVVTDTLRRGAMAGQDEFLSGTLRADAPTTVTTMMLPSGECERLVACHAVTCLLIRNPIIGQ